MTDDPQWDMDPGPYRPPMEIHLRDCNDSPWNTYCRCTCHVEIAPWSFTVPGNPPSVNHTYSQTKGGRRFKAPEVEAYQTGASYIAKLSRPKGWMPARRVVVAYRMYFNVARRDASNAIKAVEDAIAHALGCDDSIFLPCVETKEVDKANPRIEVTIRNE